MGWTLFYDTGDYYYNFIYMAKKLLLKLLITYLMNLKIPIGSLKAPGLSHIFISLFFTNYIFIFYSSFFMIGLFTFIYFKQFNFLSHLVSANTLHLLTPLNSFN